MFLKKQEEKHNLFEVIKTILFALIIALSFRTCVFEPYSIPSGSMKPNFEEGDYLFVSKYKYGISKYSFLGIFPPFEGRIFEFNKPKAGDVVVCRGPSNPSIYYIKRLAAVPGDTVQMIRSELYINGKKTHTKYVGKYVDHDGKISDILEETFSNDHKHLVLNSVGFSVFDNTDLFIVPEGKYFLLGDNRDHSADSRAMSDGPVGYLPAEYIVGKAELILFSNNTSLFQFWKWPFSFNMKRFFILVK